MGKDNKEKSKQLTNRLSRIIGQLQGIKRMIEGEKECSEILIQMSAARAALDSAAKLILQEHINTCIKDALEKNDEKAIQDFKNIIDKFIR